MTDPLAVRDKCSECGVLHTEHPDTDACALRQQRRDELTAAIDDITWRPEHRRALALHFAAGVTVGDAGLRDALDYLAQRYHNAVHGGEMTADWRQCLVNECVMAQRALAAPAAPPRIAEVYDCGDESCAFRGVAHPDHAWTEGWNAALRATQQDSAALAATAAPPRIDVEGLARALHREQHPTFTFDGHEPRRVCGCLTRARWLLSRAAPEADEGSAT